MSSDPTTWGIQPNGFVVPTASELLEAVVNDEHSLIKADLDTDPDSPTGQQNGIFVAQLARVWELVGALESSRSRDGAENALLDEQGKLTGTARDAARATTVVCTCTLTGGTTITTSHLASVVGKPETTFSPVADFSAPSTGTHSVVFQCTETGPVAVSSGTLTVISTPVSGWTAITNASAGITGTDIASDADTRVEQESDLSAAGSTTAAAIEADIRYNDASGAGVAGVLYCKCLENVTETVDGNGLPAHSIEVVVYTDGTTVTAELVEAIFKAKGAGTETYGALSGTYYDDNGDSHLVRYSVVTDVPVYAVIHLQVDSTYEGDASVKTLFNETMTARCEIGDDVIHAFAKGVPFQAVGVIDVLSCYLGTAPVPTGVVNIPINTRQRAIFGASTTTVTHV